jgi:hypothetical protein
MCLLVYKCIYVCVHTDEAMTLSKMGFLKGTWNAESEVEPSSDVQVLNPKP